MNKRKALKTLSALLSIAIIISLAILFFVFETNIIIPSIITLLFVILLFFTFGSIDSLRDETNKQIESDIDSSISDALKEGEVGVLVYNEDYEVTWTSDFFKEKGIDKTGEKLLVWLPDIQDVVQGNSDRTTITIDNRKYIVSKKDDSYVLIFKDITLVSELNRKVENSAYVIGLLVYDNYDEINETEDDISFINTNIKIPVMEYFKKYGVVYKTLRSSKMLLILNEEKYNNLLKDHFSILNKVRNESNKADLDITLSLSFARGSDDLDELDDEAQSLIELAQSRGGDQVAVKVVGGDTVFYGGSSEAKEKQSKTKVRVIYNSIKDQIINSSKVIIVGHADMDADCVGSAICMSNVVRTLNKKSYIVSRTGGIESMISDVLSKYHDVLFDRHVFISQDEALDLCDDNTLVIMVDHHSISQTNSKDLLAKAKKIIIIDHHRRKADLDVSPLMVYVEASASSTCELTAEFLQYLPKNFELESEEANIMYLGILIDTDRFRVRTGARTFDALKTLRQYGADPSKCDELAQEPYENILKRSKIINEAKVYYKNLYISAMYEDKYSRTIASQAADTMVKTKEAEASFVICNVSNEEVIVTARSQGNVNVQAILEKMNGGGHMTAAVLQRKDTTVSKVENELLNVIDEYYKREGDTNEGNTTK